MSRPTVRKDGAGAQYVRFSVPRDDMKVWKWLEAQQNLSLSLRTIIFEAARAYGYKDVVTAITRDSDSGRMYRPQDAPPQEQPAPQSVPAPAAEPVRSVPPKPRPGNDALSSLLV